METAAELHAPDISMDMFNNKLKTFLYDEQPSTQCICCILQSCTVEMY